MKHLFTLLSTSFTLFTFISCSSHGMDAPQEKSDKERFQAQMRTIYEKTNLNITENDFKELDTKLKIVYLGLYNMDFKEKGLTQENVRKYVTFLRILFPHLKTSQKIWNDLNDRYGSIQRHKAIIAEVKHQLKPLEKFSLEEIENMSWQADDYMIEASKEKDGAQKVSLYEKAYYLWDLVYNSTNLINSRDLQEFHARSIGRRLDLKRLLRVSKKSVQ